MIIVAVYIASKRVYENQPRLLMGGWEEIKLWTKHKKKKKNTMKKD